MFLRPAFWLGVGAVVVYEFLPQITRALRPLIIQGAKAGMAVADQMKVSGAGAKESFGDMMAEARMQYEAEKEPAAAAASTTKRSSGTNRAKKVG
jgi:hypothetical protein